MRGWSGQGCVWGAAGLVLATLSLSVAKALPNENWVSTLQGSCPRCVSAQETKARIPLSVPNRAIFYIAQGEFARSIRWNLIDLDSGNVTVLVKTLSSGETKQTVSQLSPDILAQIRGEAAQAWHLQRNVDPYGPPPGSDIELDILIDGKMVPFQAWDNPNNPAVVKSLITLVQDSLYPDSEKQDR